MSSLRKARDLFPLTALGGCIGLAAIVGYAGFARPHFDYVLQLVAALALGLVALAVVVTLLGAWLTVRALGPPASDALNAALTAISFEARRGRAVGLGIPRRRWLPLLEVRWQWDAPAQARVNIDARSGMLEEVVESERRMYADEVLRRWSVEDAFGLARISFARRESRVVRVAPWVGMLRGTDPLRSLVSGEDVSHPYGAPVGDRVDMRRYAVGDPLRLVLWKVYARTGQLMVRTAERAIAPRVKVLAYLVATRGDEPAAAAARVAIEMGLLGEQWIFSADGALRGTSDPTEALDLVMSSELHRDTPTGAAAGLGSFIDASASAEPVRVVVFAPALGGTWVDRVIAATQRRPTLVLLATDGFAAEDAPKRLDTLLKVRESIDEEDRSITTPTSLGDLARQLAAAGIEVRAVDRVSGRAIALGLRDAFAVVGRDFAIGRSVA